MEKFSQYKYSVEPFTEDFCGNLSWGNLGNWTLRCAQLHAEEHGFGFSQMIKLHHAWVLSRLVIEMNSMPRTGEKFNIKTWVDRLYRQFTDRHFTFTRTDGTVYGHATSIWALIDTETRMPADLEKLPDGGFSDTLIPDQPAPIKPMGRMRMKNAELVESHKAAYTDLDINGHVNSIRYIELLLNYFSAEEMKQHPARRIEMAYCLESYCGDVLDIYHCIDEKDDNRHLFEIRNGEKIIVKGSISF